MKSRTAQCPSCGAPIEFKVSSTLVAVCEFCQSAVARADRKVEDLGKVAAIAETSSPLRRGLRGSFGSKRFSVLGRVQYAHPGGGVWNEWYLSFPGDKWGWLAEAQGKFYLMFSRQLSSSIQLPEHDDLKVGGAVKLGKSEFTVTEKGLAKAVSAEGDIPWTFRPGADHHFADLTGPDQTFATFEYGDRPAAFVGKEVELTDLHLEGDGWTTPDENNVVVAALLLNCPRCGGQLKLHAPDQTERVTCGNCSSLLDASKGKLQYFASLSQESLPIIIPIGTEGRLFDSDYTVIGFLRRCAVYMGTTYPWSEYLLYSHEHGFRWLVHNDRHWSFVKTVTGHPRIVGRDAEFEGETFKLYDRGTAYVQSVAGEFYWRVQSGDQAKTADYIAPPKMLSMEYSGTENSEEVVVSLGVYLTHDDVEKAFRITGLTRPWSVGTIQPAPQPGCGIFILWFVFLVVMLGIHLVFSKPGAAGSDPWMLFYAMIFVSLIPAGVLAYLHSFEVKRWSNSDYSPYSSE